jgi:hypothetical protein
MSILSDGLNKECFYWNDISQPNSTEKYKEYSPVYKGKCSRDGERDSTEGHSLSEGI